MKKLLLFLFLTFIISASHQAQVVTTVSDVSVCTGVTTVDVPVKVSSFTAVGSISLRFSYVTTELSNPTVSYTDPGLNSWGTFMSNTSTPGIIIISAYDPDFSDPTGLTLSNNTTLFTLQFTLGTITTPAAISFVDNPLGTWLEYGGPGPNYTPFNDVPQGTYYIGGDVSVVADPSWTAYTFPSASICNGGSVTFGVGVNNGLGGTISWVRSATHGGSGTTVTSPDSPAVGTWYYRPQYEPVGEGCNLADGTETTVTVGADPSWTAYTFPTTILCTGGSVTFSVGVNNGLGGTITWVRSATPGGAGTTVTSPNVPAIGTWYYRPQYTPSGQGCNLADGTETTVTVVADPVAPAITKNPNTASVCSGDMITVSTSPGSGGAGTIADEYRSSTNNGQSWSGWSTSVPNFASVAGTNLIQSRRTADGTGCTVSGINEVSWVVNARQSISGTIYYHKNSGDVVLDDEDITLNLYKKSDETHSSLIASTTSDETGYYEFTNLCPDCEYDIVATSTHSTAYAINTTDAAQVNYWGPTSYEIEKVRFHAGDVAGPNMNINSTDAGRIQQHFVNGTAFDRSAWTFWNKGAVILQNPLVPANEDSYPFDDLLVGFDADADLYALVSGDFNRSFDPSAAKSANASLGLIYEGNKMSGAGSDIVLPLRMVTEGSVGAISLVLNYPQELAQVQDVTMPANQGYLQWAVKGNEIRISWLSPVPVNPGASEELLSLHLKTTEAFTAGERIVISLANDPLNELTDESYTVIGDTWLSVEIVEASTMAINEISGKEALQLSCHPNPSRHYTIFTYNLPFEGSVMITVNDLLGNRVASLVNEKQSRGEHMIKFDTENLPNGIYSATLRLKTGHDEEFKTIKLINNH